MKVINFNLVCKRSDPAFTSLLKMGEAITVTWKENGFRVINTEGGVLGKARHLMVDICDQRGALLVLIGFCFKERS